MLVLLYETFYGPSVLKSQQNLLCKSWYCNLRSQQPTMTLFTAAVTAALELSPSSLLTGVYAYHTVLRFDLATNTRNAPQLVSAILGQLQLDEPNIVLHQ
jgi:hypothetical protein